MPSTNFLQFDPQAVNMMDDETYNGDAQRVSGVSTGLARSLLYNKQAFQASTMVRAIANVMVNNGQNAMDNNLTSLTNNLQATFITSGANNTFTGTNTFSGSVLLNGTIDASQTAKKTILEWGRPDLTAGISIGTTFTVPSLGFIWVWMRQNDVGSRDVKINGVQVYQYVHSGNYSTSDNIWIPVSEGDEYVGNISNRMFFPCKGA